MTDLERRSMMFLIHCESLNIIQDSDSKEVAAKLLDDLRDEALKQ